MQNISLFFLFFRLKLATIWKFKMAIKTATSNIFSDFIVILDTGIATILVSLGGNRTIFLPAISPPTHWIANTVPTHHIRYG